MKLVVESSGKTNDIREIHPNQRFPAISHGVKIRDWDLTSNTITLDTENQVAGFVLPCYYYADETLHRFKAETAFEPAVRETAVALKHPGQAKARSAADTSLSVFGRRNDVEFPCWHELASASQAFLFKPKQSTNEYWLFNADVASGCPVLVNGSSVLAKRLDSGDLIQVGDLLWEWSASDEFVVPVAPLSGATVSCQNFEKTVEFNPGELVAITGKSGSGKSTLVKRIIGRHNGVRFQSRGLHEQDVSEEIGYVSQDQTLHRSLTVLQAVRYSARLRGGSESVIAESILRQVGLKEDLWNARSIDLVEEKLAACRSQLNW